MTSSHYDVITKNQKNIYYNQSWEISFSLRGRMARGAAPSKKKFRFLRFLLSEAKQKSQKTKFRKLFFSCARNGYTGLSWKMLTNVGTLRSFVLALRKTLKFGMLTDLNSNYPACKIWDPPKYMHPIWQGSKVDPKMKETFFENFDFFVGLKIRRLTGI